MDDLSLKKNVVFYELHEMNDLKSLKTKSIITKEITVKSKSSNVDETFDSITSTLNVIQFKLPFIPGSNDSKKFLAKLC